MALTISPAALNAYCEVPTERLSGSKLADLTLMVEVSHSDRTSLRLSHQDITLALKNPNGRLLYVDQPHQLNGKWELKLSPGRPHILKLVFHLPEPIVRQFRQLATLSLEISDGHIHLDAADLIGLIPSALLQNPSSDTR